MKLTNLDGSSFSLDIIGYQYPDHNDEYWDSNWLNIRIHAQLSERSWSVIDPCLTTFEVQRLIDWFRIQSQKGDDRNQLNFTEPTLQFEFVIDHAGNQNLRVNYRHHVSKTRAGVENISIDFPVNQVSFSEVIEELESQLQEFPQRVFRGQT
jgi:hypothetical protein